MAVAVDVAQSGTGADNVASFTYTHTASATPTCMGIGYAGYAGAGGNRTVTCTVGGTAAASKVVTAGDPTATGRTPTILAIGSDDQALTGARQVVVACSASNMYGVPYSVTFTGTGTATASLCSNVANATSASGNPATVTCGTATGEVLMDCVTLGAGGRLSAVGADQTQRCDYTSVGTNSENSGSTQLGSNGGVMSWPLTLSFAFDDVAVSFAAASAAATTARRLPLLGVGA